MVDARYLPIIREVRDAYIDPERRPASTAVEVGGLAREDALIEIEAVAVIPRR
jgi:enamine deaminase RidA (YjgF/YER057c/UK114 family)